MFITREQALLAVVIAEARKVADQQESFVGRTALQKILYFLKESGVPMRYKFDIHHFGPFCENILDDAELLVAEDAVVDASEKPKYSNYAPSSKLEELVSPYEDQIAPFRETIKKVVETLIPLSPTRQELLATLHFAYRWIIATGVESDQVKANTVNKFIEFKKEKFSRQEIEDAYEQFIRVGLFKAA